MDVSGWSILADVLVLLAVAAAAGALCERLRQSALVGYLAAGMLLGPHALDWIGGRAEVRLLAELGVALLLFSIGLEFSWRRLRTMGRKILFAGLLQIAVTLLIGTGAAMLLAIPIKAAVSIGAIIALSSTAVVLRVLASRAELDSVHGRSVLGILLIQDASVVPLVLLAELLAGGGSAREVLVQGAETVGGAILLVGVFYVAFYVIVPRLLGARAVSRNRELPILIATVTALGSTWAAHEVGVSPALGAFVAGMLLGGSTFAAQVRADSASLRTIMMTLFFSAVGMYAAPRWILEHWVAVLTLAAAIMSGKALIVWLILRRLRTTNHAALAAGLCLAQIGEFSFVLATTARRGSLIGEDVFLLVVSATLVTLVCSPYLVAIAPRVGAAVERFMRRGRRPADVGQDDQRERRDGALTRLLIVGFGPAGRAVAAAMRRRGLAVHVIDLNPAVVHAASEFGCVAHVGDAALPEVLDHAGLAHARAVVVALPDPRLAVRIIRLVRAAAPDTAVVVRARHSMSTAALRQAGADAVVNEEDQVGRRLAAALLALLKRDAAADAPGDDGRESA